jgi:DNA-binding NarL/FixJ family response regulator
MVSVLVVDDQEAFRRVMVEVVGATEGFTLAGEADSGEAALVAAGELSPALVLIDKRMPSMDGYEAVRRLTERHPETIVVIVSVEAADAAAARAAGAATALHKRDLSPTVLQELWEQHGV